MDTLRKGEKGVLVRRQRLAQRGHAADIDRPQPLSPRHGFEGGM